MVVAACAGLKLFPDLDRKSAYQEAMALVVAHGGPETRATVCTRVTWAVGVCRRVGGEPVLRGRRSRTFVVCLWVVWRDARGQVSEAHGIYDKLTDETLYTGTTARLYPSPCSSVMYTLGGTYGTGLVLLGAAACVSRGVL